MFVEQGVTKVRLTGGEPLLRKDIITLCERMNAIPGLDTIAITTNAVVLKRKLPALQAAGVNMLNISLDTLVSEKYVMEYDSRVRENISYRIAAHFDSDHVGTCWNEYTLLRRHSTVA